MGDQAALTDGAMAQARRVAGARLARSTRLRARLGDERLARMVAQGRGDAFAELYRRHHQALYRYCRSILRDGEDAQDALQNTMARAFAALREREREVPVRPWLFRIAHNESITLLRRRKAHDLGTHRLAQEDFTAHSAATEIEVEQRERIGTLLADLATLAERQRAALVMRELSGLSIEEIASALSTTPGAAKQALFEARSALKELAEGHAVDCESIRRLIDERDGRVLRRRLVRAHLRSCPGCQEFERAIAMRSADLHALTPPLPALAGGVILTRLLTGSGLTHGIGAAGGAANAAGAAVASPAGTGAGTAASAASGVPGAAGGTATAGSAAATAGSGAATAGAVGSAATAGGLGGASVAAKAAIVAAVIALAGGGTAHVLFNGHRADGHHMASPSVGAQGTSSAAPSPGASGQADGVLVEATGAQGATGSRGTGARSGAGIRSSSAAPAVAKGASGGHQHSHGGRETKGGGSLAVGAHRQRAAHGQSQGRANGQSEAHRQAKKHGQAKAQAQPHNSTKRHSANTPGNKLAPRNKSRDREEATVQTSATNSSSTIENSGEGTRVLAGSAHGH